MIASIDHSSSVAPFEQLRRQIVAAIDSGRLPSGLRLPSVRQLASDLDLAPNTVAKTIRELESAGYVSTRGRHGTVVADRPVKTAQDIRRAVAIAATAYVRAVREFGVTDDDARLAVETAIAALD